jgi:choline-sulfatase
MAELTRRQLLAGAAPLLFERPAAGASRPNIVFVLTDDQAQWSVGATGNRQARAPNTDRLYRQGAELRNYFVTTPVCSPSRATLMTSRYATETGISDVLDFGADLNLGLRSKFVTWAEVFQKAGYRTALLGKWHLGSLPEHHPTRHGFDEFIGFMTGATGPMDPPLEIDGKVRLMRGSTPDILTGFAIDFLKRERQRPFVLCLHLREPHASNAPDVDGKDRTWLPMPEEDWAQFRGLDPAIPNPDYPNLDVPRVKRFMREYLASVASVDRNLGRLLRTIEELRLERNTVVVFTSDNGFQIGHNGIWHKGNGRWILTNNRGERTNLWDNSLRVPAAVRWPGVIPPGGVRTEAITNLDWYPTLLAMAGLKAPAVKIRGRNFLPLLRGESLRWDNGIYAEYKTSGRFGEVADLRAWRTPEWKLVRDFRNAGRDELYHLAVDPGEHHNLINSRNAGVQQIRRSLDAKLAGRIRELE